MILWIDAAITALIGMAAGALELIKRFGDPPTIAFRIPAGWAYLGINGVAAGAALALTRTLGWMPDQPDQTAARILQILASGFGALSVLRTSVYSVKVGESSESASPSTFLKGVIDAADRQVAQRYGKFLADQASQLSRGLTFPDVSVALPVAVLALRDDDKPVDTDALSSEVKALRDGTGISDSQRLVVLVMLLFRRFGYQTTAAALEIVRESKTDSSEIQRGAHQ